MSDSRKQVDLLGEVRRELGTRESRSVDWKAVDERLFARLERERSAEVTRVAPSRRRGLVLAAAGALAAAAVVAVVVGRTREPVDGELHAMADVPGTLVDVLGGGSVLVDGKPVGRGASLRLGDTVETGDAQATVERPGKLTLTIEANSRAVVTHLHGAMVLSLERGAVEAQVVPVAAGEAFAVDVGSARVAVHGTHLRVARANGRVVVDLNEGVVAIGEAPRFGSVVGTLINAPAHVEFDPASADLAASLTQTHDPSAVRAPIASASTEPAPVVLPRADVPQPARSTAVELLRPEARPVAGAASARAPAAAPEVTSESAVAEAVRACMAERPRVDNVTVVVNTTLHLDLGDDGSVRAARFDPPVAPDVNACAAQAIYRARFAHGGAAAIVIGFTN